MQTLAHSVTDIYTEIAAGVQYLAIQVESRGVFRLHVGSEVPASDAPGLSLSLQEGDGLPAHIILTDLGPTDRAFLRVAGGVSAGHVVTVTG